MVDHLIFNKLKWFNITDNADSINANGRNFYALPSRIKLTNTNTVWTVIGGGLPSDLASGKVLDVIGAYKNTYNEKGKKRYIVGYPDSNHVDYVLSVSESNCTPIWGGKALLSHVYQWFRDAFRMVVIAC